MASLTLLIPTFNRTKKLKRTLIHYKKFASEKITIYILDASDKDMKKEIKIKLPRNFIFKKYPSTLTYTERIYEFIQETKINTDYICIGNDEDIITSKYLYNSVNFLNKNSEYAGYYGSVLTFLRPFLIFPRLSLHKSSPPREIHIDSENKIERVITYLTLNLNNLPFTFYSVRRTKDFLNLYTKIHNLHLYLMSEEVLDQIHIALSGKLFFGEEIMIIRDETKNNYVIEDNRHHPNEIIPKKDIDLILSFIKENYDIDFKMITIFINAFFRQKLFLLIPTSGYGVEKKTILLGNKFSFFIKIYKKLTEIFLEIFQFFIIRSYSRDKEILNALDQIKKNISLKK